MPSALGTCGSGQTGDIGTHAPPTSTWPCGQAQMPSTFMTCGGGQVHAAGFITGGVQKLLFAGLVSTNPELDVIATDAQFTYGGNGGPTVGVAGIVITGSTWFAVRAGPL